MTAANRDDADDNNAAERGGTEEDDDNVENGASETHPMPPLHQSPRLKGYITLLSSAVYNYISADNQTLTVSDQPIDWCLAQYDLTRFAEDPRPNLARLRYAMTAAVITILITCTVIFIHFISITGLGNKLWSKVCVILLLYYLLQYSYSYLSTQTNCNIVHPDVW
jgi:hypothetical protein